MHAAIYGRLGADPKPIETRTGKTMAAATIAVELQTRSDEPTTEWFGIVAFGRIADTLLRQKKGDLASVSGRIQQNEWTTDAGEERKQLQVIADSIVSSRSVRPTGNRRKASGSAIGQDIKAGPLGMTEYLDRAP